MTFMETEVIPWDSDFNDLYRGAMSLLYQKCKEINDTTIENLKENE